MADESDTKPVTPPSVGSGESGEPATPAPSTAAQGTSTTAALPAETPASNTTPVTRPPPIQRAEVSPSGNASPRPESSLVQGAGSQGSSSVPVQQQHKPTLPPRNYPRDPQWLNYGYLPTVPASRVLPRFFKILAVLIFITGSSATLLTFLYQRFVFPKLLLTRARLAALHQHQTSLYDKLLLSARSLVYSSGSLYPQTQRKLAQLQAPDPTLPVVAQADIVKSEQTPQEKSISDSEEEEPLFADESPLEVSKELVDPSTTSETLTSDVLASLSRLQASLQKHNTLSKTADAIIEDEDDESGLPDQTPTGKAMKSLEELSTFLTNEAFYASTPAFSAASYGWNYGASSSIPQRSGMDREKIAQVKNEIRSLKGMLLTRRNFAIPKQEIQV